MLQCVTLCYMCVNIVVCHCYDVFETQLDAVTLLQNIMMLQAVTMSQIVTHVTLLQREPSLCHWPVFSVPGMPMPAQHCSHCASPEPELGADVDTSQNPVSDSAPGHCCSLRDAENNTKQTPETLSWPSQRLHTREEGAKQSNSPIVR